MKTTILSICLGVLPILTNPAFAAEQPQPGLLGEYYSFDNAVEDFPAITAAQKPILRRVDKTIDVDAGTDAWPGTQLTDHFYIRWTGKVRIPKDGKYTFFLTSDDGSRLFIDGKQVIDNNGVHAAEEVSGAVELKSGDHDLKIEFFENEGEAVCKFAWQAPDKDKEIVPAAALLAPVAAEKSAADGAGDKAGLLGEYYSFNDAVEDFPTNTAVLNPILKRVDKTIDVDAGTDAWPGTQLTDHFYIRWTGKIRIPKDGKYTFFLTSDDGSRLFIDGKQVIDNNGVHAAEEQSGAVELKSGDHDLKIEFFENEGEAVCKFAWQAPDKDKEIVPAGVLSN
jgi:hypothetical protein